MAVTVQSRTKSIDNLFMDVLYKVQKELTDNVLLATPLWALMKMKGLMKTQIGGDKITRGIKYAVGPTVTNVQEGDSLPQGDYENKTQYEFRWRYKAVGINRTIIQDQTHQGEFAIRNYVMDKVSDMRDALPQNFETALETAQVTAETGKEWQSLRDVLPSDTTGASTGTYGLANRPLTYGSTSPKSPATGNVFNGGVYVTGTAPLQTNLRADMTTAFNAVLKIKGIAPDIIVTTWDMIEAYENFAIDSHQQVQNSKMADLGFTIFKFKGADIIPTVNATANHVRFYTSQFLEFVYDPTMWMEPTEWKWTGADEMTRVMQILCAATGLITDCPRQHADLTYA